MVSSCRAVSLQAVPSAQLRGVFLFLLAHPQLLQPIVRQLPCSHLCLWLSIKVIFSSAIWERCRAYLAISKALGWKTLNLGEGIIAIIKHTIYFSLLWLPKAHSIWPASGGHCRRVSIWDQCRGDRGRVHQHRCVLPGPSGTQRSEPSSGVGMESLSYRNRLKGLASRGQKRGG